MKYIKLNKIWNVEPSSKEHILLVEDDVIKLTFPLDYTNYQHIDLGDEGILEFSDVYAYRIFRASEEEYNHGQFRFKNNQLSWGEFYELIDSKWEKDFPNDKIILNDTVKRKNLRHFIFFLKSEIIECLSSDFSFTFNDTISNLLDDKYPKGYLNYYLAMFANQFNKPTIDNYKVFTDLYIQLTSKNELVNLKTEIKSILKNNDLGFFLKIANYKAIENFGIEQLNDMIKVIEKF